MTTFQAILFACGLIFAGCAFGQAGAEVGLPVTDALVIAKCGSCHAGDEAGNLQRISWTRTTPEGWQDALKRMILVNGVSVTAPEARSIVRYLSTNHGLAPEEARAVMYDAERRIHEETNIPDDNLREACSKCHAFARPLSWRRSPDEWKRFISSHAIRYKVPPNPQASQFLAKAAPLHTAEWEAWSGAAKSSLAGRWLVTAAIQGRGSYFGELRVEPSGEDEFNTSVRLTSVRDGSTMVRAGRSAVYGNHAWRGRSKGEPVSSAPGDPASEVREVLWIAPDQSSAEGRWFWGQYQEFGFDVKLQRASSEPTLMIVDRASLKAGSQGNRVRMIGDNIPDEVTPGDLSFGPGATVRRVVSRTPTEVVAEVDIAADAPLGRRDVALRKSVVRGGVAIYDRVDYVRVTPESALAAFGDKTRVRGYQQFEAIGMQRGADGRLHTADDVELGPVDVDWSLEVFYAAEDANTDLVGEVSATGFFTPAAENPNNNFDVWVIATARNKKDKNGRALVGKSYLVVTIPTYTFDGRRYVRDLDRWVDDGPAPERNRGVK